ncbi:MAG: hypothetical protein IJT97_10515 [Bacteroidaceae bacterium]|nr:hypothetical protein [Bacteroidaceae bacterium]
MKKIFFLFTLLIATMQMTAKTYPERLKELITRMEERADIDQDSFAVDVKLLEEELMKLERPPKELSAAAATTLRAILHGVLGTAYSEMRYSHISDFDAETKEDYSLLATRHLDQVLNDMETLAGEQSKDYAPLVKQGDGSKYYGHNMLAVMIDFVREHHHGVDYDKALDIFRRRGDRNSYTMLRLQRLQDGSHYSEESQQKYCQALEALRDSTRDIEAGKLVANTLQREVEKIMQASVYMGVESNLLVDKPFDIKITSKNATSATLKVLQYVGRDKHGYLLTSGKQLIQRSYSLNSDEELAQAERNYKAVEYSLHDTLTLAAGRYVLMAEAAGDQSVEEVRVTSLHYAVFYTPDSKAHIFALDHITGHPQSGVSVLLYKNRGDEYDKFLTDKKGEVVVDAEKYDRVRVVKNASTIGTYQEDGTDISYVQYTYHPFYRGQDHEGQLFTDRGIYRPGQTVHASAILYYMEGNKTWTEEGDSCILTLRAPDGEEMLSEPLSTNAFGTFCWDFNLPEKCKLGTYQLMLKDAKDSKRRLYYASSIFISVEEYKRPTYSIEFRKDTTEYQPESTITAQLTAETYAGIPVAKAKVKYNIEVRRLRRWYWGGESWRNIQNEETYTNERGQLNITFCPAKYSEVKDYMADAYEGEKLLVRITATATDNAGESHQTLILYTIPLKPANQTAGKKPEPLQVSKTEVYPGETIDIDFTPEDKDAYVFYYVLADEQVIAHSTQTVNGTLHKRLQCKEEWGDGATINVFYVKQGHNYFYQKTVRIPKPDKQLNLTWHTFRDRLTPGQQETWTITVKDKDGQPVSDAELMATMYDASLDELSSYNWSFKIPFRTQISNLHHIYSYATSAFSLNTTHRAETKSLWPTSFDVLSPFSGMHRYIGGPVRMLKNSRAGNIMVDEAMPMVPMAEKRVEAAEAESSATDSGDETTESNNPTALAVNFRTNFNETAFFYPQLTTDQQGNTQISFTLPESLTQWRFMGFAHTEDVCYGILTATAVASKDFMVQPQLPRFLRTADEATIQTRIFNKAETAIHGTATLRLLLAKDEKTVIYQQDEPFSIETGSTAVATFNIAKGLLSEDVICEISATDGKNSDGERTLLPVLSTKEWVTENIPFYIEDAGTKEVDLTTLFNNNSPTATDRTLTIGYTDNPALDVFHSLRALSLPQHDNAPCYAAALYSNTVLLQLHDRLSAIGDSVIENFNTDEARARADEALDKLKELQRYDGSWSWFKGMDSSPYITLAVAEHLDRLSTYMKRFKMDGQKDISKMLEKALEYLDKYEKKDYAERKKNKWSLQPTDFDLRFMAINQNPTADYLNPYLSELAKSLHHLTIYGCAQGGCILRKYGKDSDAKKFTNFIKRYLVYKPGLGRYFATDRAYYSWQDYRIPTQLAAMRCLTQNGAEKNILHDMQLWLLRQKQTQVWDNPLNGIDVADYLLTLSPDETVRTADVPAMTIDEKPVVLTNYQYREEQSATVSRLTVEKHSPGISWGYVRGTFREEAEKLTDYTTGELSIERKLYLKQGEKWIDMAADQELKVGDILRVRHIIHADRDMDFVSVASPHAACLEPQRTRSGYQWTGTRGCYLEIHDTHTDIFFDWFQRGTTTVDLEYYVTRTGLYQSGIATTQCEYAPEFGGYTKIYKVKSEE